MDLLDVVGKHVLLGWVLVFVDVVVDAGLGLQVGVGGEVVHVAAFDVVLLVGGVHLHWLSLFLEVYVVGFVAVYQLISPFLLSLFQLQLSVGFGLFVGHLETA